MEVLINNQKTELNETATLNEALAIMQILQFKGVAVAINETVVPQNQWAAHILNPGDRVLVIRATQGG